MNNVTAMASTAVRRLAEWVLDGRGGQRRPGSTWAFEADVAAARLLRWVERAGGGRIDVSVPGRRLLAVQPDTVERLARRLPRGSVVVSATNGKTTTTNMVAAVVGAGGMTPVCNAAGANMAPGVAAELAGAARVGGRMAGDIGVFELDELWLARTVHELAPRALLLGNLFRDQLDRYGELHALATTWAAVLDRIGPTTSVVLCADDPTVADLGRDRPNVMYFGVEDEAVALEEMPHAAEAGYCQVCGRGYVYDAVFVGHLGWYRCPGCGAARPRAAVAARDVVLHGLKGASFTLTTPGGRTTVQLQVPGLHNVYNAVGAAAVGVVLGVPLDGIASGLAGVKPVFGRAETVAVGDHELVILLVKNPAGANEVLRVLAREADGADLQLLGLLNDDVLDGRDVSWIWDADFELIAHRVGHAVCGGSRAAELALRLKYAGVDAGVLCVEPGTAEALDRALCLSRRVYALANYTAMLDLRDLLTERGHVPRYWR